ncbi:helix-turn-helix transcriptional regulator [Streptomyces sp. MUM 203J]|uniref:helix-turn-helix transcriptional regulator n=1 Tax=Streptomyces sp. MUM 203J TaxID=2791990 RepID=UPI001F04FF9F|nr:helix-turn-helix transcriptional regulator [Streptomyces sp. MUM 203J]MCH0538337.1 helix-turn-helix transcriptional regulator [Streptomyces sp. MUM 203J]
MARLENLQADDIQVYGWAVTHGTLVAEEAALGLGLPPARVDRAVELLAAVPLIQPVGPAGRSTDAGLPGAWKPLDPQPAGAEVAAAESRLRRRLSGIFSIWDTVETLSALYGDSAQDHARTVPLELVESLDDVVGMLEEASNACRLEVMTSQPGGGRPAAELEQSIVRDLAMIERGIQMRTLYQHTARHHAPTQVYVERATAAGAQVRTLAELFGRMIAFDRRLVFLPHTQAKGGAAVIRDPSTVAFLCTAFDRSWQSGTPYSPALPDGEVREDIKLAILAMLSEGMRDETIARRLGVSLRTCRKYIADLFELLGAESRFQAGYLTRAKNLLDHKAGL